MDLDYTADLTKTTIDQLEEAARAIGLPLRELELIGQDQNVAQRFVASVRRGRHAGFLEDLAWERLEDRLHRSRAGRGRAFSGRRSAPA